MIIRSRQIGQSEGAVRPDGEPRSAAPRRRPAGRCVASRRLALRRLLAGLSAAAVAVTAAVAVAPASPAGAVTPSTVGTRIQGSNRYGTSAELATRFVAARGAGWGGNIVLAAGTNFPDALAAATIAKAQDAPILLVTSDGSVPAPVRDWLLANRGTIQAKAAPSVTVVGGATAVPAAAVTAVVDLLNEGLAAPKVTATRVSGSDRYATAAAVAAAPGVLDAGDTAIVVSGQNFADAVSAAPLAFAMGWPIILTPTAGLNAPARAALAAFQAASTADRVIIVGGPAAVSITVEEQLVEAGFDYADIIRVSGSDRYETSLYMVEVTGAFAGSVFGADAVALATGENFADAVAAAPFLATGEGSGGIFLQLTRSAQLSAPAGRLLGSLSENGLPSALYAIGGPSAVAPGTLAAAVAAAQSSDQVGVFRCLEGSDLVSLTFPEPLDALEQVVLDESLVTRNGVVVGGSALPADARVSRDGRTVYFDVGAPLAGGDAVGFVGNPESRSDTRRRLTAPACVVPVDEEALQLTPWAVPNDEGLVFFTGNKPFELDDNLITVSLRPDVTDVQAQAVSLDQTVWRVRLRNAAGGPITLAAGDIIEVPPGAATDLGGREAGRNDAAVQADNSAPSFQMSVVTRPHEGATARAGGLSLTANDEGPRYGSTGNGWRLSVVNQRGLLVPQIAVDAAAATVTVRADLAVSNADDVERAFYNRNLQLTSGWWLSAVGTLAAAGPVAATGGLDVVTVRVTASEFMSTGDIAATAEVGGAAVVLTGRADGDGLLRQVDYTTYEAGFFADRSGSFRVRWLAAAAADLAGNTAAGNLSGALAPCFTEPCDAVAN